MVRRARAARLQRHRTCDQRADRTARARRAERHRVGVPVRAHPALLVRFGRVAREPLVRARHRDQPHRRPHHVRVRCRARARRDLRAATPQSRRRRRRGAMLCALASPLAGGFLAIVALAWAASERTQRLQALLVLAAALAPVAIIALLFPTAGSEPYEPWALIWDLSLCLIVAVALRRYPAARWGAACFALVAIGSFLVPSALGGNVSRLGQYVAGPLLACVLLPAAASCSPRCRSRCSSGSGSRPSTASRSHTDPSTRAYYAPLVSYLGDQSATIGRVEIPSTYRHWEAAYVAPHVALARGWERQLDIAYNPIFYSEPLTADSYHSWLHANGVKFVALPDARLDDSSLAERALIERAPLPARGVARRPLARLAGRRLRRPRRRPGHVAGHVTGSPDARRHGHRRRRRSGARDQALGGASWWLRGFHPRRLDRAAQPPDRKGDAHPVALGHTVPGPRLNQCAVLRRSV